MIKKEKKNQTVLQGNPYMYYVTNWGFVEQPSTKQSTNKMESLVTR